jgi:protein O-GlcNAc transferase
METERRHTGEKTITLGEKTITLGERNITLGERNITLSGNSVNLAQNCVELGDTYQQNGRMDRALALYRQAVELNPDSIPALFKTAMALQLKGRPGDAAAAYRRCLARDPSLAQAWNNLGGIFREAGDHTRALDCFGRAVERAPGLALAHFNRGYSLEQTGRVAEAMACYRTALALEPENAKVCSQLVFLMQASCTWQDMGRFTRRLDTLTRKALSNGENVAETPFKNIARSEDTALNGAVSRFWSAGLARRVADQALAPAARATVRSDPRIRVGYLSDRFRHAATAHQMLSLFGLHDRDEFFTIVYSCGEDDGSVYRKRIEQDADRFVDIAGIGDGAAARRIRQDRVDILVDLKGHTENNRLGISARRPAPVQATWLGFPGPVGADFFDYVICDPIVLPDSDRGHFAEQPAWLPHCYYPTDFAQPVSPKQWTRTAFDLPEDATVLCSFNQPYKIDPTVFDCWMAVMATVPDAVLWLQEKNEAVTANLRAEARARGIDPGRLVFSGPLPKDQHLARLKLADLCLDTRIYNGHTTTADALWVGVPVVTLCGTHFASRVSASILTALGLEELITHSMGGYRDMVLALAGDAGLRRDLAEKIAANNGRAPLFDTPRFVRNLESVYREMWRRRVSGEAPRPIAVREGS